MKDNSKSIKEISKIEEKTNERYKPHHNIKSHENLVNLCLDNRSYEPNPFSHHFKWTTKIFTDPKSKAKVIPSLPYLMPQIEGGVVLGVYQPSSHCFQTDITKDDYKHTYEHEQGHAVGASTEFMAELYTHSKEKYGLGLAA